MNDIAPSLCIVQTPSATTTTAAATPASVKSSANTATATTTAKMQKKNSRERKVSEATRKSLRTSNFDVWKWNHEELILLLTEMYSDLGLIEDLQIDKRTLKKFLLSVEQTYRSNPFHNFRHCFCVTQMMFAVIHGCNLHRCLPPLDLAILLTAAICHDLDHPGLNNSYQVNARTQLALKYSNSSPLENHHKDQAFKLLQGADTNIFENCADVAGIKSEISRLILSTDMAKHNAIVSDFEKLTSDFSFDSAEHLTVLKNVLIKACDISNECRPVSVSEPWVERLLQEYFEQSDLEKASGLPFAPFMDRDKVTKRSAQVGFIKNVLIPFFECLKKILPELEVIALVNLRKSLSHYEAMDE